MTRSPFLRFLTVSVAGVGIDLATAWLASTLGGLALPLAATLGFTVGAIFNYVLHEFWTFRDGAARVSARRGALYMLTLGITLGVRVAAVSVLEQLVSNDAAQKFAVLVAAAGLSFLVNYGLSRYVVFRPSPKPAPVGK